MPLFKITPQDLLFIGDGRPMEPGVGSGGHGARWPAPGIIFDAIHAALWRAFPDKETWEHQHHFGRSSTRFYEDITKRNKRFGSLATIGPFPVLNGQWHFPRPQDVSLIDGGRLHLLAPLPATDPGITNLPPNLRPLASTSEASKIEPPEWWSRTAFESYLNDSAPADQEMQDTDKLFKGEWTTGIGMDPETGTQDGRRIYSAEYLRLTDKVALGIHATLPLKQDGSEGIDQLWNGSGSVVVGGQQRACHVQRIKGGDLEKLLPLGIEITGNLIKWVLLSPALYPAIASGTDANGQTVSEHPGGWLPNWICPKTGHVLLKSGDTTRGAGESRSDWRNRIRSLSAFATRAKLVAARIPKPQVITGWSDRFHLDAHDCDKEGRGSQQGPKATQLAVPAGAVYYFECRDNAAARDLSHALNWHGKFTAINRRSTLLGEKGFGLGVCGMWKYHAI